MPGHCPACELRSLPADAVTRKKATAKGQLEDRTRGRFPFMGDRVIYQLGRESPPFPLEVTRRRDRPARWSYPGVPVELPVSGACGCPRVHGCSLVSHLPTACAAVCADQPGQFNDVCRPLVRCKGWYGATKLVDYSPSSSPWRSEALPSGGEERKQSGRARCAASGLSSDRGRGRRRCAAPVALRLRDARLVALDQRGSELT